MRRSTRPSLSACALALALSATAAACSSGTPPPALPTPTVTASPVTPGLFDPQLKNLALSIMESNEQSTLDWRSTYGKIEHLPDGRGFTGGIIGFCSGTGDMVVLVRDYVRAYPHNPLAPFLPRLEAINRQYERTGRNVASIEGLGQPFAQAWQQAAKDPEFQKAQVALMDDWYFNPAVRQAQADGLHALGQFIYFDAIVNHGPGENSRSFGGIRLAALKLAKPPSQGGDEITYLQAFLTARLQVIHTGNYGHDDRVTQEQQLFLNERKLNLERPLRWSTYGDQWALP